MKVSQMTHSDRPVLVSCPSPRQSQPGPDLSANLGTLGFLALLVAGSACGGSEGQKGGGPCARDELDACGQKCDDDTPCPTGLYCGSSGTCSAECSAKSVSQDCEPGGKCDEEGRCAPGDSDAGGDGDQGDGDQGDGDGVCGEVDVQADVTEPTVILIIDQSGSMNDPFEGGNRWDALQAVLLGNDGLISELEGQVKFGLALYTGAYTKDGQQIACPALTSVAPALDNFAAIDAEYGAAVPLNDTPTGDAITAVLAATPAVDPQNPTIFVLATDGEPDTCEQPNPQQGQAEAIEAVMQAHSSGVDTFVLAVAEDGNDGISSGHAQELANAGVGGQGMFYRVTDRDQLEDALRSIVTGQLDCFVKIQGLLPENTAACEVEGSITLGGQPLVCDTDWVLADRSTLELKGEACDRLKAGDRVQASFTCDGIILF
jgi:hypothetical protein